MPRPRIGINIRDHQDAPIQDVAARAEDHGYDSVWVAEVWDADAFVLLERVANHTTTIDVGTAVVSVYSRSPATLAMASATLNVGPDARVLLGVGTSSPYLIERLHGLAFDRPIQRTHETIELVKHLTTTAHDPDRVTYEGEIFTVTGFNPLPGDVRVYNAALGPANRRVTGRVADGWLPQNVPFPALPDYFAGIATAAREAGRDPGDITVSPVVPTAVTDDGDTARDLVRGDIAYLTGSTDGYRNAAATEFPAEANEIARLWSDGEYDAARQHIPDEMLRALTIAGTPATARDQLRDLLDNPIVDRPILRVSARADAHTTQSTVDALAPDNL